MKRMLGILLIAGAVAGAFAARRQILAAMFTLRDKMAEAVLLALDDPEDDEEDQGEEYSFRFEGGKGSDG